MGRMYRLSLVGGLGWTVLFGVAGPSQAVAPRVVGQAGGSLTVYAAASLKEAFTTIGTRFAGQAGGAKVVFNFGGSDILAAQIVQGAPADVFASANNAQMTLAHNKGAIASTPITFVRNRLVVIVPRDNPGRVYSLPDLGRPGLRLVLAAPQVPVGKYARAAFTLMASDAAFGPDFLRRITANTVSNETDVKAVATKVLLGEADAGVVYVTDVTAKVAPKVQTIEIPAPFNQVAKYPIAVVKGSHDAALAARFIAYVRSPAGQAILHAQGFITTAPAGGYAPTLQVTGLVAVPATLGVATLRKLPMTRVTVTLRSEKGPLGTATYTGALLYDVIQAATPISNTGYKNDLLRQFITVHATDGYEVTVAMAEILPNFGGQQALLAYARDGKPLAPNEGAVELVMPGDHLAGRDVKNVDRIVVGAPFTSQ